MFFFVLRLYTIFEYLVFIGVEKDFSDKNHFNRKFIIIIILNMYIFDFLSGFLRPKEKLPKSRKIKIIPKIILH